MAREVKLRVDAKMLREAEGLAKSVKVLVGETKQSTTEAGKDVNNSARALKARAKETDKARKRAKRGRVRGIVGGFKKRLAARGAGADRLAQDAMAAREKSLTAFSIAGAKGARLAGISTLLPAGPAGVITAGLVIVYDALMGYLEEEMKARLARHQESLLARVDRKLFEADYKRRLAEDPQFHRSEAERAYQAMRAHQTELARRGLTPQALGLLERF